MSKALDTCFSVCGQRENNSDLDVELTYKGEGEPEQMTLLPKLGVALSSQGEFVSVRTVDILSSQQEVFHAGERKFCRDLFDPDTQHSQLCLFFLVAQVRPALRFSGRCA